jgi:outer membrane protein assembly factor BamB
VNDRGVAGCYEAKTGKRGWYERLGGGDFLSSPVLVDGRIYAAGQNGDMFALAAEPTYRLLARNALGEGVTATPATAGGRLFIRGEHHLFCVGSGGAR